MNVADSKKINAYYNLMPVYKRQEIPKLLDQIKQGAALQIYLLFGERYLCRNAAQELIDHLLPEQKRQATSLQHIDGDQEDYNRTLNLLKTFSLFSGRTIYWVTTRSFSIPKGLPKVSGTRPAKKMNATNRDMSYNVSHKVLQHDT